MLMARTVLFLMILLLLSLSMVAGLHAGETGHRQHDAHVHGAGALNVALEGKVLAIELRTPAINIVGFEHPPRDEADREALIAARETLMQIDTVFMIPAAANCTVDHIDFAGDQYVGLASADEKHHGSGHRHEHESAHHHGHGHRHGHDHDHAHSHGHGHSNEHAHADIHVLYELNCENPEALTQIGVKLFERFPGTERLELQVIGRAGQDAFTLTPGRTRLPL